MIRWRFRITSAVAATCIAVASASASAQTPPAPPAAVPTPAWCPLMTHLRELDDTHTRYAVSFGAFETGRASGVVALWAGDRRYDVSFRNAVAVDSRDRTSLPTPVVVRFAAPTVVDGAVVTSIEEGGALRPCEPWFSPWVARPRRGPDLTTPDDRRAQERFLASARATDAVDAPPAVSDPKSCTAPDRPPRTVYAAQPTAPRFGATGLAVVLVVLDAADKIVATRIQRSTGDPRVDAAALSAARASEFQGEVFRCRHIVGSYLFTVQFDA
jgi:hypothetical protein